MPGPTPLQYPFPYKNESGDKGDDNPVFTGIVTADGFTTTGTVTAHQFNSGYQNFGYQKVSFTPNLYISGTAQTVTVDNTSTAAYVKIGAIVMFSCSINFSYNSGPTGAGDIFKIDLPFPPEWASEANSTADGPKTLIMGQYSGNVLGSGVTIGKTASLICYQDNNPGSPTSIHQVVVCTNGGSVLSPNSSGASGQTLMTTFVYNVSQ